ncbi:glycine-rich domain-containing protein [Blastomonas sp. SL216]|uniref:glycine-rich domain-containing protein n=1 Tax=Blastomonas sp. SL216 TaxID=2995169 RepID=UPI002376DE7F|nr:hypothetical protein OU999_07525 [Blastomonas sp. SL216]
MVDDPIWRALADMRIEPQGAALTFTRRLARENGWSRAHAEAVMEEYRRFLYLAATGTGEVTPSDQVDQAWHLHLAYTRHYWEELCARIIGRPLHHGPTAGGGAESRKYRSLYADTLARYRAAFGQEPPSDIWPPSDIRFGTRYQWVDRSRHILLPRKTVLIAAMAGGASLLAACTALVAKTAQPQGVSPADRALNFVFDTNYGIVVLVGVAFVLMLLIGTLIDRIWRRGHRTATQRNARRRDRDDSGSGSSDSSFGGWSESGGGAAAAGGAAFVAGGGDFGGGGAEGSWDSGGDSGSSDSGGDSGCSSGCGGGCGGGD